MQVYQWVNHFPKSLKVFFSDIAGLWLYSIKFFRTGFKPPIEWAELLKQSYNIGNRTLALAGTTAFIIGLVLTMQSRPTLQMFGAEAWLPAMVGISIVREIGPVITALICAGKIGSSIGAELGSMKVTEQIDAMEVTAVNPFKYLVTTRILASMIMLPILVIASDTIALLGSWLAVNIRGNLSMYLFFKQVFDNITFGDLIPSIIKSVFFGFTIALVGCYKGFNASRGTEGVGEAANSAVVVSSLLIFIIDLVVVQIAQILGLI